MDTSALGLLTQFLQYGAMGFVALSIMFGWLVPAWTYREKSRDAEAWKGLYESERAAHANTRDAYVIQGERLQVAVESAKVTEYLLREARGRAALAPERQAAP